MKKVFLVLSALAFCLGLTTNAMSQSMSNDSILVDASLENCIKYALVKSPTLKQAEVDRESTESQIKWQLGDWYPQISATASYQNTIQKQAFATAAGVTKVGKYNTSAVSLGLTQNIFNRDALLALKSAGDVRTAADQQITSSKIDIAANVAKAFYDVILTVQQLKVLDEGIVRIKRSIQDAYNGYKAGTADKTDYTRATITLNNQVAQQKSYAFILKAKKTYLKQMMGYPEDREINLHYDSVALENSVHFDTSLGLNMDNRIEYQQLQTQKKLYEANLKYEKWSYIPSVSAFANYNLNYLNDQFSDLYKNNFPNSYVGVQATIPIFQGFKRKEKIRQAELQLNKTDWQIQDLRNSLNTQYAQAMSVYRGDLESYDALKDNLKLAQDVYNIISLQYKAGVKTYLEVITAETDLRTAQINYANILYQLLSDKVDVQKALGSITLY